MINQLKLMRKTELCVWASTVKVHELKLILKEAGVKGYSKFKKAELLVAVLDLVCEEQEESTNAEVEQIMAETVRINEELKARQGAEESIGITLIGRLDADEITFDQYKACVYAKDLKDAPIVFNREETLSVAGDYNEYSKYWIDEDKFGVLNSDYNYNKMVCTEKYYDCIAEHYYSLNLINKGRLSMAFGYSDDQETVTCVYKDKVLLGHYVDCEMDDIRGLVEYDDRLDVKDLVSLEEMYGALQLNIEKHVDYCNKEKERERKEYLREENYKKAYKEWTEKYLFYTDGKWKFEDIYNNDGEIWNRVEYYNMKDYVREKKQQQWEDMKRSIGSSMSVPTIKEEDKDVYRRIYKIASLKLHPDVAKDDGRAMTILNGLKEQWGI